MNQHTELEHTPKPTFYQQAKKKHRDSGFIVGEHGGNCRCRVCDIGGCCSFLGLMGLINLVGKYSHGSYGFGVAIINQS